VKSTASQITTIASDAHRSRASNHTDLLTNGEGSEESLSFHLTSSRRIKSHTSRGVRHRRKRGSQVPETTERGCLAAPRPRGW
jgi:hypothetical protein